MSSSLNDKDYVASLEKGLLVLNLFNENKRKITLSETANLLDMTRATARRFLKTLEILGYLESDSKYYWLTPKVLNLSKAFLTSDSFYKIAQYYVKQLAIKTEETSYICIKNGFLSTVIACEPVKRKMQVNIQLGDIEPLWSSSSGRIFLAHMPQEDIDRYIKNVDFNHVNEFSVSHPSVLISELKKVKDQGYCFVNQEQEKSLVSLSIPLRNSQGNLIATLNITGADSRFSQVDIIRKLEYMFQVSNEIKNNMTV
ncbi:IclR family transcriptional regulator domain-containing protein [Acinetobacter sp. Lyrl_1]|uniref:IclR family transcriptional regulator domain-containing protein n=1 Tax=Acinetobacter sp. Lyrl_1 TaxID=3110920 RepID=UPI003F7C13A3